MTLQINGKIFRKTVCLEKPGTFMFLKKFSVGGDRE
jgi:hypothetical protein